MRRITIIGGGIAGLTLGVLLRQRAVPVQVWEARAYPRHRVCGEFISGRGAQLLLKLFPPLQKKAVAAQTVQFYAGRGASPTLRLPVPGLSIARWDLDHALAQAFVATGGELVRQKRWTESLEKPGVVRASGRRVDPDGRGWLGLKAHFSRVELTADLEMHFSDCGYIGLSRLAAGVNICALARGGFSGADFRRDPHAVFERLLNAECSSRIRAAELDPGSCCAVAGISFQEKSPESECCVGDAIQMIPPFTGNGMSLAVESAFLAAEPLSRFAAGFLEWSETVRQVNSRYAKAFRSRFRAASFLARAAHRSWTRRLMLSSLRTFPELFSLCFRATR